jgi:hypothetical protein
MKLFPVLDAQMFFHELRPFLSGGEKGMVFQKSDGSVVKVKWVGGSAAQSSLFQFLDLVLGVEHQDADVFEVCLMPFIELLSIEFVLGDARIYAWEA